MFWRDFSLVLSCPKPPNFSLNLWWCLSGSRKGNKFGWYSPFSTIITLWGHHRPTPFLTPSERRSIRSIRHFHTAFDFGVDRHWWPSPYRPHSTAAMAMVISFIQPSAVLPTILPMCDFLRSYIGDSGHWFVHRWWGCFCRFCAAVLDESSLF